jgi:hypothetical protein
MKRWNYRVISFNSGYAEIKEVYYDEEGNPSAYCGARIMVTNDEQCTISESLSGQIADYLKALARPILKENDFIKSDEE